VRYRVVDRRISTGRGVYQPLKPAAYVNRGSERLLRRRLEAPDYKNELTVTKDHKRKRKNDVVRR
jgi:hypothetical protein